MSDDLNITGKLKKIIWRSLENDFTIAVFEPEKLGLEFIATGDLFKPAEGITYNLSGKWEEHHKYGEQFRIQAYCVQAPCDSEGIAIFLERHVKGVGPVLADKLIEKYGKHTLSILKGSPERISNENKGISYKLALGISEQLSENDKQQEIIIKLEEVFAKTKGLPRNLAQNVISLYGLSAFEVIKNNPYVLTSMARIGFLLADKVALACGVKHNAPERIKAGILYVIEQQLQATGNVWIQSIMIEDELAKFIPGLDAAVIADMVKQLVDDKVLVINDGLVTLTKLDADESTIADSIVRLL